MLVDESIIGKIACDTKGEKLGNIVDLRGSEKKVLLKDKPHIIILVKTSFWKRDFLIAIETKKINRLDENKVFLTITKEEFSLIVKKLKAERKRFVKNANMPEASEGSKAASYVYQWRGG